MPADLHGALPQGISHFMLGVRDLAASVRFYRDLLGLEVQFESPGFAFMRAGSVTLVLSEPLGRIGENIVGATEIVFSVDDVVQSYELLRSRGVKFIQAPRSVTPSDWAANFLDPDGHRLSVFGPVENPNSG